jgi:hypothetical protein
MSRESNDAFDEWAKRKGYKPGTWNYIRTAEAWQAATLFAEARCALSAGAPASPAQSDVHPAAPQTNVASPSPRSEPCAIEGSELPREPS